jgi:hypothetical protein
MIRKNTFYVVFILILVNIISEKGYGQNVLRGVGDRLPRLGGGGGGQSGGTSDSLRSRSKEADSISLKYYFLDSSRAKKLDSSISDFTTRFPIPPTHIYLGNTGSATRSLLFAPSLKLGFDPGFHAFDVYKWNLENVRFFNTTRPYTELSYSLASRAEQVIELQHTQNLKPYWNIGFHYRLINAPGVFRNQKTNHNNYLLTSWYQSPSKRYNNYFVVLSNVLQSEQSGGIKTDKNYLDDPNYAEDRFTVPSNIGGDPEFGTNFFNKTIYTGNRNAETNILLRQQYDFGRKDSLVTDSTVIPLFFPRVRFEHNFKYGKYSYLFKDEAVDVRDHKNNPDSTYYASRYDLHISPFGDSLLFIDKWKELTNDFSIYQFPDANNLQQFIKLGVELQFLTGQVQTERSLYNLMGHGEYRNRSKNQKWDIDAFGKLFFNGYNAGDYHAYIHLLRVLSPRAGSLQAGFENISRSPSFLFNSSSNFYLDAPKDFNKENIVHFFAVADQNRYKVQLRADYYLVTNYLYITDYYKLRQESTVFNVLRVNALKTFNIGKSWRWHAEVYVQQKIGSAPVNIPNIYTRHRFAYEGNFGFRNLNIAIGTEIRANTPYKADNFSPILQQFFYQNSQTITNYPRVDGYLHFRIRSFRAYLRFENLNTLTLNNGLKFNNHNFSAPGYPEPGLITRFGIYWSFVN